MSQKQHPSEQFLLLEGMVILSMGGMQSAQFVRMRLVGMESGGADMKDFAQQHDDTSGSGESCDINQYAEGERHDTLDLRINGKFRCAVWTDKEHIKCLGFQKASLISNFIHTNGSQNQDQEHRQGSDHSFHWAVMYPVRNRTMPTVIMEPWHTMVWILIPIVSIKTVEG